MQYSALSCGNDKMLDKLVARLAYMILRTADGWAVKEKCSRKLHFYQWIFLALTGINFCAENVNIKLCSSGKEFLNLIHVADLLNKHENRQLLQASGTNIDQLWIGMIQDGMNGPYM